MAHVKGNQTIEVNVSYSFPIRNKKAILSEILGYPTNTTPFAYGRWPGIHKYDFPWIVVELPQGVLERSVTITRNLGTYSHSHIT